jgi:hypothetical protein
VALLRLKGIDGMDVDGEMRPAGVTRADRPTKPIRLGLVPGDDPHVQAFAGGGGGRDVVGALAGCVPRCCAAALAPAEAWRAC